MPPRESILRRALHVFTLASLTTAPVLLVADAQFFIGRGASGTEVLIVALALVLGIPAALAIAGAAISLVSSRAGWVVHLALIGALGTVIVSEALYPLSLSLEVQAPLVLLAGVAWVVTYARAESARSIVSALLPLPALVLAFVLLLTPVAGLVFGGESAAKPPDQPEVDTPVVMIVFDELPGHALMTADGRIDAKRFPNFAALGRDANWYPNATTSRGDTELAVPTLATGIDAPLDSLGVAADHPESLFTLLGSSHQMHVSEPWTNLCPEELCDGTTRSVDEAGVGDLLGTIAPIFGYVSVPDAKRLGIPSPRESGAVSRPAQVNTFVDEIESSDEPVLHFLHVLIPHKAWRYLPTGARYPDTVGADAELGGLEEWDDQEWPVLQAEQRFLLQLEYTDELLGRVLDRLKETGVYDESVVVVAADHGVSFRAGDQRRDATESNAGDILSVPLFVKLPNQRRGRVDKATAQTVDVVPTIADAIGAEVPWEVDGVSLLEGELEERPIEIENLRGGGVELSEAEYADLMAEALARRVDQFGDGNRSLYEIGPSTDLHGKLVEPLLEEDAKADASLVDGEAISSFEPGSEEIPARIAGDTSLDPGEALAVALNGRIAATTYSYDGDHGTEFAAMIPPELLEAGDNELEIFTIEGSGGEIDLHAVELKS